MKVGMSFWPFIGSIVVISIIVSYSVSSETFPSKLPEVKAPSTTYETQVSKGQAAVIDIKCKYQFYNIEDSNELSRISQAIGSFAMNGRVNEEYGRDSSGNYRQYNFVITGLDKLQELNATLPYRNTKQSDKTVTSQIYEEFDPQYQTNFRTVTIKGSLEVIVSFKITPGAELFYSLRPGQEIPVPKDQIDYNGNVSLKVRIARDQQYIYARTVLGQVNRYLRIDIESGQPEEIIQEQYLKR